VAGEDTQYEWAAFLNVLFMPKGDIDDYEGKVFMWNPDGSRGRFNPNGGNWL
jgi:hypothetical protein